VLVAMPGMPDGRFARSVIYLCRHSRDGAMGLVVNRRAENLSFRELLVTLKIVSEADLAAVSPTLGETPVVVGGPVEPARGFVLHSNDFVVQTSTVTVDDGICLTATTEILRALARGQGPRQAVLALGCATWTSGQLETEIQANAWLNCPADSELIFGRAPEAKYDHALRKLGIDLAMLSNEAGHA
jgi:putative transcriptional regulator